MTRASIWSPPAYVYLLPLLPVLRLFVGNTDAVTWQSAAISAAIVLAAYIAIRTVLVLVFSHHRLVDPLLACLYAGVFLAITFIGDRSLNWYWAGAWAIFAVLLVNKPNIIPFFNRYLPIFIAAIGAQALFFVFTNTNLRERSSLQEFVSNSFADTPTPLSKPTETPDVYYIVFDRYARQDMLAKVYGFDNSHFLAELEKRGFVVPREAYANYQRTASSIVSTLNMDYLDKLQTPATENSSDWVPIYSLFQDFRAARAFKSMGYGTHFYGTWWEPTRRVSGVDENHTFNELPEALRVVYEYSLIVDVGRLTGLRALDPLWWQCQRSNKMFDGIAELSSDPKPTFTFAHFLIPHPPFVTHETGRCMDIAEAKSRSREQNYIGQLTYANGRILALVDSLLSRPGPKPIILLQSDEGPWPTQFAGEEVDRLGRDVTGVKWLTIDDNLLREKMAIFSAYYVPDKMKPRFNNRTSPVNTFRFLLKDVFGVEIDPLPEKNMIFESSNLPYRYHDVTGRLYGP